MKFVDEQLKESFRKIKLLDKSIAARTKKIKEMEAAHYKRFGGK